MKRALKIAGIIIGVIALLLVGGSALAYLLIDLDKVLNEQVAKAKPDGYTLAQMPMGMFRIPHMQKKQSFDPIADFTYISCLTGYTFGLVVPADSPKV